MKLFAKRAKGNKSPDQLAGRISNVILKMQSGFSKVMTRATKGLSVGALKWLLFAFLLTGTTISIYVATTALSKRKISIEIKHLQSLPNLYQNEEANPGHLISDFEYQQLQKFHRYADSLHKANARVYDSILKFHPGLLDSVKSLESLYKNQFQNQK